MEEAHATSSRVHFHRIFTWFTTFPDILAIMFWFFSKRLCAGRQESCNNLEKSLHCCVDLDLHPIVENDRPSEFVVRPAAVPIKSSGLPAVTEGEENEKASNFPRDLSRSFFPLSTRVSCPAMALCQNRWSSLTRVARLLEGLLQMVTCYWFSQFGSVDIFTNFIIKMYCSEPKELTQFGTVFG